MPKIVDLEAKTNEIKLGFSLFLLHRFANHSMSSIFAPLFTELIKETASNT
jgi:hypothetical protein